MKSAFIFPGQGSQYVGMAKDLYESFTEAKELFDLADNVLGFEISKICFEGPSEKLKQTYITQPAIFIHSLAVSKIIGERISPVFVSGHSLGEYTALTYSGTMSFEDGLKIVKLRGELMQMAGEISKGTMAAVIGLNSDEVERICDEASSKGVVEVANFNSPGQIVISGEIESVNLAMDIAKQRGAKMVKQLEVHGAFHSPLMLPAAEGLRKALKDISIGTPKIPVFSNVDAKPLMPGTPSDEIRESLFKQLTSPVRWEECVLNMVIHGVGEFIELGPGKVLQGLVKRISPNSVTRTFDRADDIRKLLQIQI